MVDVRFYGEKTGGGGLHRFGKSGAPSGWLTAGALFHLLTGRKLGFFRAAIQTFAKKNISAPVERCVYSFDLHGPTLTAVGATNNV